MAKRKRKKQKKQLQIEYVRKSRLSKVLTQSFVVKIGVIAGLVSFLFLFAPIFFPQTGRIAVIMFGVRGFGFALMGAVSAWIVLLLAGHIWDLKPVGQEEWKKFRVDFCKRSGMCLAAICLLGALTAAGLYFGTDNVIKSMADCGSGYVQASGRVTSAYYDHHRYGPSEFKYRVEFAHEAGVDYADEIVVSVYRKIRASNTGAALAENDEGLFCFYPQTQVIDDVYIY